MPGISIGIGIGIGKRLKSQYWTPLNLVATVVSDTAINLTWTGGKVAKVERSTDGINYTQIGTGTDSYYDVGLTSDTLYYYRVKGSIYSSVISTTTIALPTDIAVPNLWIKADDLVGNDGDLISSWISKEGNNYSFEATLAKRPTLKKAANGISGHNVVSFDGSANILSKSGRLIGAAGTVFAIVKFPATQNNSATVLGVGDEATIGQKYMTFQAYNHSATPNIATAYAVSASDYAAGRGGSTVSMNQVHLMRWQGNGALLYKLGLNRLPQTLTTLYQSSTARKWLSAIVDADNTAIGGSKQSSDANLFKGDIAEIISYDSDLADADVAKVEAYLSSIYGLSNLLYVVFGDSIANGVGASDAAHSWRELIAVSEGCVMANSGINSTCLQNTVQNRVANIGGATVDNGRDTYTTRIINYKPNKVFILYGLNDIRLNDAAFTPELFENDLSEVIDGLLASGISAQNIIIGSPTYMNDYAASVDYNAGSIEKHQAYVAKCASVATNKSTKYKDIYQYMIDNGGDTLISADGIHPNDAGHAAIATAFLSVI